MTCEHPGDGDSIAPVADDGHTYSLQPYCGVGGAALCREPVVCQDADGDRGFYMEVYRDGEPTGRTVCVTDAEAREARVVTAGLVVSAFRRLAWPASDLVIQPPRGRTLVNFETNFFTDNAAPTTRTVRLLGQRVTIEATPVEYVWDFGDGEQLRTTEPGTPYPRLEVTHNYFRAEAYRPAVDTVYAGRFRPGRTSPRR